jgi:hypothetical protein
LQLEAALVARLLIQMELQMVVLAGVAQMEAPPRVMVMDIQAQRNKVILAVPVRAQVAQGAVAVAVELVQ